MTKKKFTNGIFTFLSLFFLGSFVACKENAGNNSGVEEVELEMVEPADTVHTTQNSVDYAGTYKGVIPCADCEGIEVELTVNMDSSYTHSMKYLGKGDGKPVIKAGKYVWVNGGTIQLEGVTDGPSKYKVGEGRIWQLDMQGNKIEGDLADKYILTKTN
jgi:uncharacterized lipoprotein NlpE involved in copper resistance